MVANHSLDSKIYQQPKKPTFLGVLVIVSTYYLYIYIYICIYIREAVVFSGHRLGLGARLFNPELLIDPLSCNKTFQPPTPDLYNLAA